MADFNKRLSQIIHEILAKIAQIEELKGRWIAGSNLSPQTLLRLKRSVLIISTGASTRIHETIVAMKANGTVGAITNSIYIHPA